MSNKQSNKYFNEIGFSENKNIQQDDINNLREKIKLEFTIQNSSNAFYSINVILFDEQNINFNSENKQSHAELSLKFEKFLVCDYYFEKQQNLQITINKNNQPININTTLGCIIGARHSTYTNKFLGNETLIIKGEKMGQNDDFLEVKFTLKENGNEYSNYFLNNKMTFIITCKEKKLYSSEEISPDGKFAPVKIPICLLMPVYTVSFYNVYNQLVTSFNKTIQEIVNSKEKLQLKIPINNNNFLYLYDYSEISQNFTFLDFIKAGVRIGLSIGIDFTGSNGHPLDLGTLHSLKGDKPNDYERAIRYCGDILAYYDYDQLFPVYGFGAIVNSSNMKEASMCFNLNFQDNPDIYTINNVIQAYHECIEKDKLTFSGPTEFAPIIQAVISKIGDDIFHYYILMILTDGVIDDLQETIDCLVAASQYPLSIIIVGIGNEDFKKMEILDGDEAPLISSIGQKRTRDLVQFVSFSKFQNDEKKLAEEVLAEIPKQIVEYYKFKNLNPNQIQQLLYQNNQYNNNNFNQYNINGNNNNYENYPSLEELQKKNDIDLNNLPINETVVLNPNNIK
jgi:hypothetical protein